MRPGRRQVAAGPLAALLLSVVFVAVSCSSVSSPPTTTAPPSPYAPYARRAASALRFALKDVNATIPATSGAAAPSLPPDPFKEAAVSHEVLGFLPSWELGDASELDYSALSEIAYFALQAEPGGTYLKSGQGWDDLVDGLTGPLVETAHASGVRMLLTLYSGTQSTLAELAADPSSGRALADRIVPLLERYGFDGVDLDLEGQIGSARTGFVRFVKAFSDRLRTINTTYVIVLDTAPQAAVDDTGFYDISALAPYVDDFYVMDYDMTDLETPEPTAPLIGQELCDTSSLTSFVATVPPSKVILGIPFYGLDYTVSRIHGPSVLTSAPYSVAYDTVLADGAAPLWDPSTETAYVEFRRAGKWNVAYFDDPASVALKVALAAGLHAAGVGVWELGMATGHDEMTQVLDGGAPPVRLRFARSTG